LRHLRYLRHLGCSLRGSDEFDFSQLAGTSLETIFLTGEASYESTDIGPLAGIPTLHEVIADVPTHGWARLAELPRLDHLQLSDIDDLAELTPLRRLSALTLCRVPGLEDLQGLSFLDSLRALGFERCLNLRDISGLTRWADSLTEVRFSRCYRVDLAPLAALPKLRQVSLLAVEQADLTPLAGKSGLTVYVNHGTRLVGAELLGPGSVVERWTPAARSSPARSRFGP